MFQPILPYVFRGVIEGEVRFLQASGENIVLQVVALIILLLHWKNYLFLIDNCERKGLLLDHI